MSRLWIEDELLAHGEGLLIAAGGERRAGKVVAKVGGRRRKVASMADGSWHAPAAINRHTAVLKRGACLRQTTR